jgi:hypothetical protein
MVIDDGNFRRYSGRCSQLLLTFSEVTMESDVLPNLQKNSQNSHTYRKVKSACSCRFMWKARHATSASLQQAEFSGFEIYSFWFDFAASNVLLYSKPSSLALRAACVRSRTPSLPRMLLRWFLTVPPAM